MRTVDETHACTHAQRDKVNKMPTSTCISAKRNKVPTLLCKSKRRLIRVETRNTMSAASYFGCDCAVEAAAAADANASPRVVGQGRKVRIHIDVWMSFLLGNHQLARVPSTG